MTTSSAPLVDVDAHRREPPGGARTCPGAARVGACRGGRPHVRRAVWSTSRGRPECLRATVQLTQARPAHTVKVIEEGWR